MKKETYHRMADARRNAGIFQDDAAAQIGVSRSILSRMEHGLVDFHVEQLKALCALYGVSVVWAITGEQVYGVVRPASDVSKKLGVDHIKKWLDIFNQSRAEVVMAEDLHPAQKRAYLDAYQSMIDELEAQLKELSDNA